MVVEFESLGGLTLLASAPLPDAIPDLDALAHAAGTAPWGLATLHAVAGTASLRAAATVLRVHHSTLQDRIVHFEHLVGWSVRSPSGKLRLEVALALRSLRRHS
jgi:DNA-binding PucR family transcriptional regulator